MSQHNVELVRRFYEVTSGGDGAGIKDIVSAGFVDHHFPAELPHGPAGVRAFFTDALGAFTDRKIEIFDIFATDEMELAEQFVGAGSIAHNRVQTVTAYDMFSALVAADALGHQRRAKVS